jgi:DNA-binding NtrC family response regulator
MTETKVLINGEYGTGRRSVAQAIHQCSNRKDKPFVSIACGELPEPIIEALLLGKHASSASKLISKKSLLAEAEGGTVFIEDIDTMSKELQKKLFEFFKDYRAAKAANEEEGNQANTTSGVRFIAGSAVHLKDASEAGSFLVDLYKQFASVELSIPPLRDRKDDILPIATYILKKSVGASEDPPQITPDARALMFSYSWPGNISELATTLLDLMPKIENGKITHDMLPEYLGEVEAVVPQITQNQNVFQGRELRKFLSRQIKERQAAT